MLEYDHAPLGDVAFSADSATLYTSGTELRKYAADEYNVEVADKLTATADWYEAFALDLAAIHNLPQTGLRVSDEGIAYDEDIPF